MKILPSEEMETVSLCIRELRLCSYLGQGMAAVEMEREGTDVEYYT